MVQTNCEDGGLELVFQLDKVHVREVSGKRPVMEALQISKVN